MCHDIYDQVQQDKRHESVLQVHGTNIFEPILNHSGISYVAEMENAIL